MELLGKVVLFMHKKYYIQKLHYLLKLLFKNNKILETMNINHQEIVLFKKTIKKDLLINNNND